MSQSKITTKTDEMAKELYEAVSKHFKDTGKETIDEAEAFLVKAAEEICGSNVTVLEARQLYSKGKHL